jgi:CHAT domain-containing protein/tetratricopeptide (TPR) repeat protein
MGLKWDSDNDWRKRPRASSAWLCSVLLAAACTPALAAQSHRLYPVLARQCSPIAGAQEVALNITAPAAGTLRIEIQERGISTVATLDDDPKTASASPIERFGTLVLTAETGKFATHKMRVRVEDSQDIAGQVCVSADLIQGSERVRGVAEREFAVAGRAVHSRDWETSFAAYLAAARGFDDLRMRRSAAMARHAMAELAYRRFDRKRDAYALAVAALAYYRGAADPIFVGLLAGLQAKALLDMPGHDPRLAAPAVREQLSVARRYDTLSRVGARELPRLDILTGFVEFLLDAPAQASRLFAQAAQRCRELQDWDCYATATQNLAQLAEEDNNYAFALAAYADALRLLPPALDPKLTGDISTNLGRLQGVVGLFSNSERSQAAAMQAYSRLGDCRGVRLSLSRSGKLLVQVGSLADAENELDQAAGLNCADLLALTRASAAPGPVAAATVDVGTTGPHSAGARETRDRPCARPLDAATLATENKVILFNALESLGEAFILEGEFASARRCLDAAQRYADNSRSQIRLANARGTVLLERDDANGARRAFEQALHIADDAHLPATYEHRGSAQLGVLKAALLAGKAANSLPDSYQVLESSIARGDIDQTITSLRLISAGYRGSGKSAAAVRTLQVAADLIEAVPIDELDGEQRATFLATQHTVFAELTDLFASQSPTDDAAAWQAFEASERGRARSLRYALTQSTRNAASPIDAPPTAKYQQLLRDIVHITTSDDTSEARATLVDEIDGAARHERSATEPLDRAQLTRTLKKLDATLVEYAVGSHDMYAFIIGANGARVVRLGDNRAIASASADLRDRLRDAETAPSDVRAAAGRVARLVLWPLSGFLSGQRIIFVPDDALHTVPLAALPWSPQSGQQLVLQHAETAILPSALFLLRVHSTASAHSQAPRIELIGDPVFRVSDWRRECIDSDAGQAKTSGPHTRTLSDWTESLPRLPGTRAEVTGIGRLARQSRPASRVETLLGCAAVATALRKAATLDVDLLHIATHARIDAQRPRLSALALTPEAGTDGPASAFGLLDILGLKLNSRLVVLSACETSRGRLLPGEGVLGPAQAFLQAGAAAVLASYWRVDDHLTADFMQRFYKYLLVDRLTASAALRQAQLDYAAAGTTYEWAAFALYGWPDTTI